MRTWIVSGLLMAAVVVAGRPMQAQRGSRTEGRWADECRDRWHDRWNDDDRDATYCEVRVERLGRHTGPLAVDGRENGGIEVEGSDGDSIVVHAIVQTQARSEDLAKALAGEVHIITDGGPIRADGPSSQHRSSWVVSYHILVPRRTDLTVETVNGPVSVEDVTGRMDLRTENGPLTLDRLAGDVRARAENGPVDVSLRGTRWDGVGLDAETENGPVDLTVPSNYAAHLETGTETGPMAINFPITVQGRLDTHHLSLDIGGGGPPIRVVTTNGPVTVTRQSR